MKIYKAPDRVVYDTEKPEYFERLEKKPKTGLFGISEGQTHFEFFRNFFPEDHPIFQNFGESYFFYYENPE